tara:strand:+ start:475 stop:918 length:444 start_codon:yes stop_codon:yes gene_type:complete
MTTTEIELSTKKKQGNRPAKYKQSIMARLMELIAEGNTTRQAVKELNVSWTTLRKWLNDKNWYQEYLKARADSVLLNVDDMDRILAEAHEKAKLKKLTMTEVKLLELMQRGVQFRSSKLNPQIYGSEKQMMSIQDSKGNEFKIEWQK